MSRARESERFKVDAPLASCIALANRISTVDHLYRRPHAKRRCRSLPAANASTRAETPQLLVFVWRVNIPDFGKALKAPLVAADDDGIACTLLAMHSVLTRLRANCKRLRSPTRTQFSTLIPCRPSLG